MTVRIAVPADAAPLAALAEQTFRDAFGPQNHPADLDTYCALSFGAVTQRRELLDPGLVTWLSETAGELTGYAQLRLDAPHDRVAAPRCAELRRLYVASAFHGAGVAQALMDTALSAAERVAADWLWLGVWEHNPRAIAFYRKYGFREVGEQRFQIGSDLQRDLVMGRSLRELAAT
jgi:ribosomal protein S18 acetylase RimI-like enzyme